jgi:cytochrome c-type biogenesis protein CcmH/NrfG
LYTNRSLAHHQLADHASAHADGHHVLVNLDSSNVKALMRRGFAAKMLGNYEESVRDFQALLKTKPANEAEVKKELDEAMKKLVEQ